MSRDEAMIGFRKEFIWSMCMCLVDPLKKSVMIGPP